VPYRYYVTYRIFQQLGILQGCRWRLQKFDVGSESVLRKKKVTITSNVTVTLSFRFLFLSPAIDRQLTHHRHDERADQGDTRK
jgi:hypothetical protein